MTGRVRGAAQAASVALALALWPASALAAPPQNLSAPQVWSPEGAAAGALLTCGSGAWSPPSAALTYTWERNGAPIGGAAGPSYTLTRADEGTAIACAVTATADGQTTRAVSPALAVAHVPEVRVTRFSPIVAGDVGAGVANAAVTVRLLRGDAIAATATGPIDASTGAFSVELPGGARPSHPGDRLDLDFNAAAGAPDRRLRLDWASAAITADGQAISAPSGPGGVATIRRGSRTSTAPLQAWPALTPAPRDLAPLTDEDEVHVTAVRMALTAPAADEHGPPIRVLETTPAGLPGRHAAPVCSVDLTTERVGCDLLPDGSYLVTRVRADAAPVSETLPITGATYGAAAARFTSGLRPGDRLDVRRSAAGRVLASVTVGGPTLAVDAAGDVRGTCRPGSVLNDAGTPLICPAAGAYAFDVPDGAWITEGREYDDRSGGWTVVSLLLLGGLFYSLGAIVYALRRPDPSPRWFGFHEVFHAFVVLAALAHYVAMAGWVIPSA